MPYLETKRLSGEKRRKRYGDYIAAVKTAIGCEVCGYHEHSSALQFDHINPELKEFHVSRGRDYTWDKFLKEIAKCRVLCANCHAIHTHG